MGPAVHARVQGTALQPQFAAGAPALPDDEPAAPGGRRAGKTSDEAAQGDPKGSTHLREPGEDIQRWGTVPMAICCGLLAEGPVFHGHHSALEGVSAT